jgi:uncharacterized protein (TIGR03083 family)
MKTTRLAPDRYLELLRSDAARLAEAAAASGLDKPVPPCPGWTVRDAVQHTAAVYHHKIASMRLQRRPAEGEWPQEPADADLLGWFLSSRDALLEELVERGPDAPSHTWSPPEQTVGFWYRRMAHETAVHRFDVESASGEVTPVADDLAVDGVDEVLELMLAGDWSDEPSEWWGDVSPDAAAGKTVAVRTGDRAWRVTLHPDRIDLSTEPGPADASVTGEPSEVLLWLWGRRPDDAVRFSGDLPTLRALRDRLRLATD